MTEKTFLEYLAREDYKVLSEQLTDYNLDILNKHNIHPYLKKQTIDACEEVLLKNKNRKKQLSYEDYLRGTLLATKIITTAVPNAFDN